MNYQNLCLCYLPQLSALADNTDLGFNNSWYHAQPHPIINYCLMSRRSTVSLSLRLWQIIELLATDKSRYFAQPRLTIVK